MKLELHLDGYGDAYIEIVSGASNRLDDEVADRFINQSFNGLGIERSEMNSSYMKIVCLKPEAPTSQSQKGGEGE